MQNINVNAVVFSGTQNGLRIKTWGRPSTSFVKGVNFRNVIMNNVQNPIIIDQNYCPDNYNCPNQVHGKNVASVMLSIDLFSPFCWENLMNWISNSAEYYLLC